MTDATADMPRHGTGSLMEADARTARRNAAEKRFRLYGLVAVCVGLTMLALLLTSILSNGLSAFRQAAIDITVALPEDKLDKSGTHDPAEMAKVTTFGYAPLLRDGLEATIAAATR